jgi:hypothetical protein
MSRVLKVYKYNGAGPDARMLVYADRNNKKRKMRKRKLEEKLEGREKTEENVGTAKNKTRINRGEREKQKRVGKLKQEQEEKIKGENGKRE